MTAEEAMDRIGTALEAHYDGRKGTVETLHEIAQIRGAYLTGRAGQ